MGYLASQPVSMNIGFDAKRAFHNNTGLGNYSRTLINGLARFYPDHKYFLFNPKPTEKYPKPGFANVFEINPKTFLSKRFSSIWRSTWVKKDLQKLNIHLYHGLSHEIPMGINEIDIPSVVTIHDLIFEKYPKQFNRIDVEIYRKKFRYACKYADRIIAISKQTKNDIAQLYSIDEKKIDICYQSCDPAFSIAVDASEKEKIRKKYDLPASFFLYVGSIIERKNLLNIVKAMLLLPKSVDIPLVVIGNGSDYKKQVETFISQHHLNKKIIFLSEHTTVKNDHAFQKPETLAAIYQLATALIYPSFYEGFGLPVLEALWSKTPVITSNVSCLPETGGNAAYYVNPSSTEEIAEAMKKVFEDEGLRNDMIKKGWEHAQNFTLEKCTASVMQVYKKITGV